MKALLTSKAFFAGILAALVIGAVAAAVSATIDRSARSAYTLTSVRL